MRLLIILTMLALVLNSCSIKPEPIEYGTDACVQCMMTIIDSQHAAEGVTSKGKVLKFDAIECLVNYKRKENPAFKLELVNTFDIPELLMPADSVVFIISESLPSPMGAYLTAFSNRGLAENYLSENPGTLYTWNEILQADRIPKP